MWFETNAFRTVVVEPTIVAAAYSSGDVIGAAATRIPNASGNDERPTALVNVIVTDKTGTNIPYTLYFFDEDPSAQTDNGALALVDADGEILVGVVEIVAGKDFGSVCSIQPKNMSDIPLLFKTHKNKNLWMYVQVGTGGITFSAADDLNIKLLFAHL